MVFSTMIPIAMIRAGALAGALVFASTLAAQSATWFPLEVGNSWLYRPSPSNRFGQESRTISVHGTE